jgi:hypothetical protein
MRLLLVDNSNKYIILNLLHTNFIILTIKYHLLKTQYFYLENICVA